MPHDPAAPPSSLGHADNDNDFDSDDVAIPRPTGPSFTDVMRHRLSRRQALRGFAATGALAAAGGLLPPLARADVGTDPSTLTFRQTAHEIRDGHHVAPGYRAEVLIRWGDKVLGDAPPFVAGEVSAAAQARQFGYNNDYIGYLPLPLGSSNSEHGLLCVNHEYTIPELMWPGIDPRTKVETMTAEQVAAEMAAHGHSVIEVEKRDGRWRVVEGSRYARRLTAGGTVMAISGPAAGHLRLRTSADPSGTRVIGTINNCAGGVTPWGTVLIAEENIHYYFGGDPSSSMEAENHARMGIKNKPAYAWHRFHDRFDVAKEPTGPNRFGWMVEFDPHDPTSLPVKRTALGRFKHEGAATTLTPDGRVVVYTGDDQRFEYLYKFVSHGRVDPMRRDANRHLLDSGTLFVARFEHDGTLRWLPLTWGDGPLTSANGFDSQADVLIETRRAADLMGATPMDRPEEVEPNPLTGRVYLMLTNNSKRKPEGVDAANPRGPNPYGHVVELLPPGTESEGTTAAAADHGAQIYRWNILLKAGNPAVPEHGAAYHPQLAAHGCWLAAPDNCTFDAQGRLWISTDQGAGQRKNGIPDGMYACDLAGAGRGLTKLFFACPRDAEMSGPAFTPDGRALFVAVQHPAEAAGSTYDAPSTRWPDFTDGVPPRPSIVAITKDDGGLVGS